MSAAEDRVRVTVFVRVAPERAFDVFTLELDAWWRRGPAYRLGGREPGTLHLVPELGGRVFEQHGAAGALLHEIGRVVRWERPRAFAFTWRGVNFSASDPDTMVEVTFVPQGDGTVVTLVHRGLSALRPDHPVRHGQPPVAFLRELGGWWAGNLRSLVARAGDGGGPGRA